MKQEKEMKISYWAAHFTTIVSVTLVLILVGILAIICIIADIETRKIKENIELSAILCDSVSNEKAASLAAAIKEKPYARSVRVVSKEEALRNWTKDTGEDLMKLFGVNPLSPEVSFTIKSDYASENNIKIIAKAISALPDVESVAAPDAEMVASMNKNIENAAIIIGVIAVILLIISFVLINNMVYLTIYSRRFTIHTMQLVGATNGFIRRPIVGNNLLTGVIAGVLASSILAIIIVFVPQTGINLMTGLMPSWVWISIPVFLIVLGAVICTIASTLATNRFLKKRYEELFT